MADSAAFELASEVLERDTSLGHLEARGTVRLALKEAGLDGPTVTPEQMIVVVGSVLPRELELRGVADPDAVCAILETKLAGLEPSEAPETPDAIFKRLGGR